MRLLLFLFPLCLSAVVTVSGPASCKQGTTCAYTGSGGTGPYVYTLKTGSVGSINSSTGIYTAPSTAAATQREGGCPVLPNNHIFNTRIDALPVHANNVAYIAGLTGATLKPSAAFTIAQTEAAGNAEAMHFYYLPGADGNFHLPLFPTRLLEAGEESGDLGATYRPTAQTDHHFIGMTKDTCLLEEMYKYYPAGFNVACPTCNSQGGVALSSIGFTNSQGTDAAGLPLLPLTIRPAEMTAGAINHAMRLVLANNLFNYSASPVWPAVANGSAGASCTTCSPYGGRVRLKAGYTHGAFDGVCATAGCQAAYDAVVTAGKQYGWIISDIGTTGEVTMANGPRTNDVQSAITEFNSVSLILNATNAEFVDESSLQTSQNGLTLDPAWFEAKLDNTAGITPTSAVVVVATDSLLVAGQTTVALQGVVVGVTHPVETLMVGSAAKQLTAWVTGASNTAVTWSLSPSGGTNGTITSGGLYTLGSPTAKVQTTATATSVADGTQTATVQISIIPAQAGSLYVAMGRNSDYTDLDGVKWYGSHRTGDALLFDNGTNYDRTYDVGAWTNTGQQPALYDFIYANSSFGTIPLYLTVPNGSYTLALKIGSQATATNQWAASIDAQGAIVSTRTDYFTASGAYAAAFSVSTPVVISDGNLKFNMRNIGSTVVYSGTGAQTVYEQVSSGPQLSGFSLTPIPIPTGQAISGQSVRGKRVSGR